MIWSYLSRLLGNHPVDATSIPRTAKPRRYRPVVEQFEDRATPAQITVTSLSNDPTVQGSLPWAVRRANQLAGADRIDFQPGLTGSIILTERLDTITEDLDIQGNGASAITVTRHVDAARFRIFEIDVNATCNLSDLTVTNGVAEPVAELANGGGIRNFGALHLNRLVIEHNSAADSGGGIYNACGNEDSLQITDCTIRDNTAGYGGGMYNTVSATTSVHGETQFTLNHATINGGGICNNGTMMLSDLSNIQSNDAASDGGGAYNTGVFSMVGGMISGNRATRDGGGVFIFASSQAIRRRSRQSVSTTTTLVETEVDFMPLARV